MWSFLFVPLSPWGLFRAWVGGWISSRRNQTGALSVTVSAPVVTQTRDEAGALHLTVQEPQ